MKKIFLVLFVLVSSVGYAQKKDTPFEKEFFKDRSKDEYKEARSNYNKGKDMYDDAMKEIMAGGSGYKLLQDCIPFLEKADNFNPNYSLLNYMLGFACINTDKKYLALDYFLKAYELNPTVSPDIHFEIGEAYHLKYNWDKGIYHYELFKKTLNQKNDVEKIGRVNKKIEECYTGKKLQEKPERVWIDNLGKEVNSPYAEYAPFISADESVIIFTGRRNDSEGGKIAQDDGKYFEDIYIAYRKDDGTWDKAKNIGSKINTDTHDAPAGLSPDGRQLFVFYGWKGGGDIYQSTFENGEFSKPEKLNSNISSKNYESSASISFDGKELYFASIRDGGFGEEDIYVSYWDEKKKEWGPAQNLGPVINTKYRETGIYLHPDGETMYFASEGHETMGGFDIFVSKKVDGKWTKPVNIGYPINSPDDDVFFVVSGSGRFGYYSSFREDGLGEKDLYRITFLGPAKEPITQSEDNLLASQAQPVKQTLIEPKVEVKVSNLAILKGTVKNAKTLEPIAANLEIINNSTNALVTTLVSDAKTGAFMVSLPSGVNYGIAVKADGYLFHSENIDLPASSGYKEYHKDILLKKVEVGEAIVLRNIFFDYDKATLRPQSQAELERLTKLMNDNPTLKIEISGHTDTQGDANYNKKLSEARAKAVVDYLIGKGISASRLEFKGYGEEKPIISDTELMKLKTKSEKEEAHQMNRRTEFKILSK